MDDLSDLIDCMDYGFHQSLSRAMMMRSDAIKQVHISLPRPVCFYCCLLLLFAVVCCCLLLLLLFVVVFPDSILPEQEAGWGD